MDAVGGHLAFLRERNLRPGTIEQRRRALSRLRRHLGGNDDVLLGVAPATLRAYVFRTSLAPEGQATEISHLRQFYKWCLRLGYINTDPMTGIDRPRTYRRLPRPMADGDLAMGIELAPDRIRPMLMLGAYAGLRALEIAGLHRDNLMHASDPPIVLVAEGKGGGMSSVPIPVWVAAELNAALPKKGWCFPYVNGRSGPIPAHMVSHLCNRYLHSIGIDSTLHQARHWFGTNTYRTTGRDLRATQELLRHQSPVSTSIYTWVEPGELADAVERLPRFAGGSRFSTPTQYRPGGVDTAIDSEGRRRGLAPGVGAGIHRPPVPT